MKKIIFAITTCTLATVCHAQNKASEPIEKSFSWVAADKNDLQRVVYDRLKRETPYPNDINIDEQKLDEKRSEAQSNLSRYENQGRKSCNDKFLPKDANKSLPPEVIDYECRGTGLITDPDWDKYYKIRSSEEYRGCLNKITEQPEHKALKEKQKEIETLIRKRRDFDESTRKNSEKILESIITDYSQQNNIQLIIYNRSDAIIYNKDLVVLDVTPKIKAIINSKKTIKE